MVKVLIGNVDSRIVGYLSNEVHATLDRQLSFRVPGAIHTKLYKQRKWDGRRHLYRRRDGQAFFSGLISIVLKVLKYHHVEYQLLDGRKKPEPNLLDLSFHASDDFEERGYQTLAREQAIKKGRGIIKIATGGGKTYTTSSIIGALQTVPFNFYVTTTDLLEQAHEVLSETLKVPIGKVGGGEFDLQNINVCTVQTAVKSVYLNKEFNIKDYSFDDEDNFFWKEKDVAGYDNLRRFRQLMHDCKGFFFDECISGESLVKTEKGLKKIKDIPKENCKYVLSNDGSEVRYEKILNFWDKGVKDVYEVITDSNIIVGTNNHLIKSDSGWKRIDQLKVGDKVNTADAKLFYSEEMTKKISSNTFSTKLESITQIKAVGKERVYDIEVENSHCFYANNILVHNCHHAGSKTIVDILTNSPNAYYRFGGSATPYREDNADLILQGAFGQKLIDVNASYLIENGWLVEPSIIFEKINHDCNLNAYQSIYSHCITQNEEFNAHVANTNKFVTENGLSSLILVQHYAQGDMIKKMLGGDVDFVTGKMSKKKRKKAIEDLKEKRKLTMIATTLADEGLDIPTLDMALLAGGGASGSRVNQRIGRTLRIDRKSSSPRDKSAVIYYDHDVKYLKDHTKRVKKILKEEPRFNLLHSNGGEYIKNEISSIFKLGKGDSLFDLLDENGE